MNLHAAQKTSVYTVHVAFSQDVCGIFVTGHLFINFMRTEHNSFNRITDGGANTFSMFI